MTNPVIVRTHTMVETSCYTCGFPFMVPQWFEEQCRDKGRSWYCPSCQKATLYKESELTKLARQIRYQTNQIAFWESQYEDERERHERTESSRRVIKGHLTKLKKRVSAGVCPCCHRSFQNLARHMKGQHPAFIKDEVTISEC